jgi:Cu+-exporting ATPase
VTVSGTSVEKIDLEIEGMTCAGCAVKVEKALASIDGAEASVNAMTDSAAVTYDPATCEVDDLVAAVSAIGYSARPKSAHGGLAHDGVEDHSGHGMASGDGLGPRLVVSALLTVPVAAISMIPALQFDHWAWVAGALATPVTLWGAWPFHKVAVMSLRHGMIGMDTLVSLGVLAAWGWSVGALLFAGAGDAGMKMGFHLTLDRSSGASSVYFEVAAAVTTLILLGRVLEARAKREAGGAVRALLDLVPPEATLIGADGSTRSVPASQLVAGDRFIVRPAERIATDGLVVDGESAVDRSILTGESIPEDVAAGDRVAGGTVNGAGRLTVEATAVGDETQIARIAGIVRDAQSRKAPVQKLVDRISSIFVPTVIVLAVLTFIGWIAAGASASSALTAGVAVLVVACPCALGLATPAALLVASGRGAQLGVLVRGPEALEASREIDAVLLDKTGTLTTGELELVSLSASSPGPADELLLIAGSAAASSGHPVSRALTAAASQRCGDLLPVSEVSERGGLGVTATVGGRKVMVGRPEHLQEQGMVLSSQLADCLEGERSLGRATVVAGWDAEVRLVAAMSDGLRPGAKEAVEAIRLLGAKPILLTGDSLGAAEAVAAQVGIEDVRAQVLPDGKAAVVEQLQQGGLRVAMAGDGVNDSPALTAADLGIAIGGGADAAVEAADLALLRPDPRLIADSIALARRTLSTIRWNLVWAFGYNVAALPLAMAGLLEPMIAAAAMAFSSVFVIGNALRLRSFRGIAPRPSGR